MDSTTSTAASGPAARDRMPDEWYLREFDHVAPELAPVLPETLGRMRTLCPVAHSELRGGYWG
jgi:hypothetical protein